MGFQSSITPSLHYSIILSLVTLLTTIAAGLKEVWAHKFRSLLTMLGIILGVASLVGMAAIIKGMENGMKESMIAMGGADKVLLEQAEVPAEQEHLADQAPGRTMTMRIGKTVMAPPRKMAAHTCGWVWLTGPAQARGETHNAVAIPAKYSKTSNPATSTASPLPPPQPATS